MIQYDERVIPTEYLGIQFKSKLEAKWAFLLTFLDIEWQYEPRYFPIPNQPAYLPDFFLPQIRSGVRGPLGTWLEIKPCYPGHEESERYAIVPVTTKQPVILVEGMPEGYNGSDKFMFIDGRQSSDQWYQLCHCKNCCEFSFQFSGYQDRISCACKKEEESNGNSSMIQHAITKAYQEFSSI